MKKLILSMSAFYIGQNFLGAIGHLLQSTGLEEIMIEADVFLLGTAKTIISGKDYYAKLRAQTLLHAAHVYPTLEGICWVADSRWEKQGLSVLASNLQLLLEVLSKMMLLFRGVFFVQWCI